MTETLWIVGGAVLVLLILSGFFSGSETALTAASRARMHQLSKQGNRKADLVLKLHEQQERLIGSILLGNNLVNILASALATSVFLTLFGDAGVAYATIIMTMLVLVFAEVLPKTLAISNPDKMAIVVAPVIRLVTLIFWPITLSVQWVVRVTLRLFGVQLQEGQQEEEKEEELRGAIELHDGEDPEYRQERQMLRSILELDQVEVSEIMTHRSNVTTIDLDEDKEANVKAILSSSYTRLPLTRGDPDNIVGVLHAKALLRALHPELEGGDDALPGLDRIDLEDLSVAPWFIPETTTLLGQLEAFKQRREHFATVVDEYGSFMGIVTLEDILEEIVGDITDEHDVAVKGVWPQPAGGFIIDGTVTLRDLNREFDWNLPDDDANTIAGLVLFEARRIPEIGQKFDFFGFRFEILRRQRNQITSLKVYPPAEDSQPKQVSNDA